MARIKLEQMSDVLELSEQGSRSIVGGAFLSGFPGAMQAGSFSVLAMGATQAGNIGLQYGSLSLKPAGAYMIGMFPFQTAQMISQNSVRVGNMAMGRLDSLLGG